MNLGYIDIEEFTTVYKKYTYGENFYYILKVYFIFFIKKLDRNTFSFSMTMVGLACKIIVQLVHPRIR